MEPGTILVCPTTTPAWTPLFSQARGLVTDVGGILAHGSIVAREYGIPAVLGTGIATTRIGSGQTIRVDGDSGTVTLLDGTEDREGAERTSTKPASGAGADSNATRRRAMGLALAAGTGLGFTAWLSRRKRS
ncbi:MAG TPA: PEP-utilizing enzyme [Rubrobacter sp.]|jgi:phosphoenolpyruvate synthase/pyruvate phosphate dikinase|nr:PEP-utilizing enzyme [Rubrobacter sp.]